MKHLVYGKRFWRSARKLPPHIQEKLGDRLNALSVDPFHPVLHTKPLAGELKGVFSFRVTRDWRVTFYFTGESTIYLLEVNNRKDIYC